MKKKTTVAVGESATGKRRVSSSTISAADVKFPPHTDGVGDRDKFNEWCEHVLYEPVELFDPWNDNEGSIGLAINPASRRVFVAGLEPHFVWPMTLAESVALYRRMIHESEQGGVFNDGKRLWLDLIIAALKGGAK